MSELTEFTEEPAGDTPPESSFATVAGIDAEGISLIFDGQDEATEKRYKCNCFAVFKNGDRVKVFKDSGTYVVEYPVGTPKREFVCTVAERLETSRKISLTGIVEGEGSFDGSADAEIKVTKFTGAVSEAETAKTLKTGRTIALSGGATGTATTFDGSKNITIQVTRLDASKLSGTIRATAVENQYSSSTGYNIQFQSDYSGKIYARVGTGAWKQISN